MQYITKMLEYGNILISGKSVADPGSSSQILDPDFYPSRIPDPTGGKENLLSYIFLHPQISQN
jgi:hypothetical protein